MNYNKSYFDRPDGTKRWHTSALGIYIQMIQKSPIHKVMAQPVDNSGQGNTKYCVRMEERGPVPSQGCGERRKNGHRGVDMCIAQIASSVKHSPRTPDRNLDAFTYPHQNCPYNQLVYKALRQLGVGGFRMNDRVRVGAKAPDFALPSQSGEMVRLNDFLGKPVVLFFYLKDNTLGCAKEVCAFRDDFQEFGILDADVIGISSDSVESHRAFVQKHDLPFALLSDEGGKVRNSYGVPNTLGLFPGRVTYVLDEAGVVKHIFSLSLA